MGLLDVLGLPAPGAAGGPAKASSAGGGGGDDGVVAAHDAIAATLTGAADGKARDALEAALAALRAGHARNAPASNAAAQAARDKAELAEAALLQVRATALAAQAKLAADLARARADVTAGLTSVRALVLSGILGDAARKTVSAELGKLESAGDKAAKIADPKAALAGFTALSKSVHALQERADGARGAAEVVQSTLAPMIAATRAAMSAVPAGARPTLQSELDQLEAQTKRDVAAFDLTSLQSIVLPRLTTLRDLVVSLPQASNQADVDLARAAKALQPLEGTAAAALQARLGTLQALKQAAWPAGDSLDQIAGAVATVSKGAAALVAEAENLGPTLARRREIAILRKRLDGMKPRTDAAAGPPGAGFLAPMQKRVVDALANFAKYEATADQKSCEILFSQIGAALDALDVARGLLAATRSHFAAARDGGIKQALALKLKPDALAALRTTSVQGKQADIESMIDGGNLVGAEKAIAAWLKQARTWADAPDAYNDMRSGKPDAQTMKKLIAEPGGGEVFDAMVEDLPANTPGENVGVAIEARFGTRVTQFNHRPDDPKEQLAFATPRQPVNPKEPQKGLKELYKVLRKVPVKDVSYTERIVDNQEQGHGAYYQTGGRNEDGKGKGKNDEIVLYAGRPDDADNNAELGNVVAPGDREDPDTKPVGGDGVKVNWYSYATLHEVGHGVDDARHVMNAHRAEAGWEDHAAADVARKVAGFYGYDAKYVEELMGMAAGTVPRRTPPRPATVRTDAEWERARQDVVRWVGESRIFANPWDSGVLAKANAIGGRVYQEPAEGTWVSYFLAARTKGIRGYQFRAPGEWFAELYAAYHMGKLGPKHPSNGWLAALQSESEAG